MKPLWSRSVSRINLSMSIVSPKSLMMPRSLSVECSARPVDTEPAMALSQIRAGFEILAPLLLARAREDEATYGVRSVGHLIVKWKLFPGAAAVRQAQSPWPAGLVVLDENPAAAQALVAEAMRTFEATTAGRPFKVSRVVLSLKYTGNGSSVDTSAAG